MVAETALAAGNEALAASHMQIAMEHSFAKVLSMASVDPDADPNYLATATEVSDFIAMKVAEFNAAPMSNTSDPMAPSTLSLIHISEPTRH